jgi:serine/threonine protein kinase
MSAIDPKIVWPGWETVRLIGRGSFGAVYEIERSVLGEKEKAALKVISMATSWSRSSGMTRMETRAM